MPHALVLLAQGCEELEAITITDLLVRAQIKVTTCGLTDKIIHASRGATLIADTVLTEIIDNQYDIIILPGGLPGADHLRDSTQLLSLIKKQAKENRLLAAICAAPKVLAQAGLLKGKTVTCYLNALSEYQQQNITISKKAIEIDGNIITSRGPGTAMDFALKLIEILKGSKKREEIEAQLLR